MMSVQIIGATQLIVRLTGVTAAIASIGGMQAVVGTDLSYARFVHDGTPPHVITARNKKALYWPGANHPVRSVNHPGYKGNPFLTDALADKQADVATELTAGLADVLAGGSSSAMQSHLMAAGLIVQGDAMRRANVKTGQLRQSLHTEVVNGRLP